MTFAKFIVCGLLALVCSLIFAAAHALDERRRARRSQRSPVARVHLDPPPSREPMPFAPRATQRMPLERQ